MPDNSSADTKTVNIVGIIVKKNNATGSACRPCRQCVYRVSLIFFY